tara:strand:+ start:671 stop:817 length:147 start_codon:yes stop_codon:yes gene_type:complete
VTKKKMTNSKGDVFEWEETEETRKALEKLRKSIRENIESQASDYGVGK